MFGVTPSGAQGSLLMGLMGPCRVPGIESRSTISRQVPSPMCHLFNCSHLSSRLMVVCPPPPAPPCPCSSVDGACPCQWAHMAGSSLVGRCVSFWRLGDLVCVWLQVPQLRPPSQPPPRSVVALGILCETPRYSIHLSVACAGGDLKRFLQVTLTPSD